MAPSPRRHPWTSSTLIIVAVGLALTTTALPASAGDGQFPLEPGDPAVDDAVGYLQSQQGADGSIGGFSASAWVAMSAVHAGEDPDAWTACGTCPSLEDYLVDEGADRHTDGKTFVPGSNSTDWSRQLLALETAGVDGRNAGGVDYVEGLVSTFDGEQFGSSNLMNDDYFAILALDATGEAASNATIASIVDQTADWVLFNQFPDGGWSWRSLESTEPFHVAFGPTSDVDSTASAIQSLVATGHSPNATEIDQGFTFIQTHQYLDGGCGGSLLFDVTFSQSLSSNTASTSWAVDAIVSAGEDPTAPQWTTATGNDLVDFLLSAQNTDGGFPWQPSSNATSDVWMTAYVVTALTGSDYVAG